MSLIQHSADGREQAIAVSINRVEWLKLISCYRRIKQLWGSASVWATDHPLHFSRSSDSDYHWPHIPCWLLRWSFATLSHCVHNTCDPSTASSKYSFWFWEKEHVHSLPKYSCTWTPYMAVQRKNSTQMWKCQLQPWYTRILCLLRILHCLLNKSCSSTAFEARLSHLSNIVTARQTKQALGVEMQTAV